LRGFETCPPKLQEEHGLWRIKNGVLGKTFQNKREQVISKIRKPYSYDVRDLYSSRSVLDRSDDIGGSANKYEVLELHTKFWEENQK
jgi:hypothetical protein